MTEVRKDCYLIDGYRYARVTQILDCLGDDMGHAQARMTGEGVAIDAGELMMGIPVRDCTTYEEFVRFLATDDKYYSSRYESRLGMRADRGSLVDLAFRQILEGSYFDRKAAEQWCLDTKAEWDTLRKLWKQEYEEAKAQDLWIETEEMRGRPMYPVSCDLADVADRILCLQDWWGEFSEGGRVVGSQETLYCRDRKIAGTPDLVFSDKEDRLWLIDIKATAKTSLKHACQLAAYDDLFHGMNETGERFDEWAIAAVRPDDKGRMKVFFNRVKDKRVPKERWVFAQALYQSKDAKVYDRAKTKELTKL